LILARDFEHLYHFGGAIDGRFPDIAVLVSQRMIGVIAFDGRRLAGIDAFNLNGRLTCFPITVRKTGFIARKALASLPDTVPALAKLVADVFSRISCAAMARPLMSKMESPSAISFPFQRAGECADAALEKGQAGTIGQRIFGKGGLLSRHFNGVAIQ